MSASSNSNTLKADAVRPGTVRRMSRSEFFTPDVSSEAVMCAGCGKFEGALKCPLCIRFELPDTSFCTQACYKLNFKTHAECHARSPIYQELQREQKRKAEEEKAGGEGNGDRGEQQGKLAMPSQARSTVVTEGEETLAKGFQEADFSTWINDRRLNKFVRRAFGFTGPLRPWPTTPRRVVPVHIPRPDYAQFGISRAEQNDMRNPIKCYNKEEIAAIREACQLGRKALDLAHSMCRPGVTADAIDEAVHNFLVKHDAYPSPLNYFHFPKSCCVSVNEVICHGIPDLRPLRDGDIVNVDVTAYYKGFHGDLNETYVVGEGVDNQGKRLIKAAHDALQRAIAICKPGIPYKEIGNTIDPFIKKQG